MGVLGFFFLQSSCPRGVTKTVFCLDISLIYIVFPLYLLWLLFFSISWWINVTQKLKENWINACVYEQNNLYSLIYHVQCNNVYFYKATRDLSNYIFLSWKGVYLYFTDRFTKSILCSCIDRCVWRLWECYSPTSCFSMNV